MGGFPTARRDRDVRRALAARERRIAELTREQHGVVSRSQLLNAGVSPRTVERRRESGQLLRIHGGVYAIGHNPLNIKGRWMGAVLACGQGSLLSHRSAAALWGFHQIGNRAVEVTAARGRQRKGIVVHEGGVDPQDRATREAIPITTVARTLLDLAEVVNESRLERAWEEADRLRLLRLDEVAGVCSRGYGRHGLRPLRELLERARRATETRSPLEDRFARFVEEQRLPEPSLNVLVLGHEVDALWPRAKLIVEVDSFEFHGHRAAFERDRRRDAERIAAGYRVLRVTSRRLEDDSEALSREIRALLDRHS